MYLTYLTVAVVPATDEAARNANALWLAEYAPEIEESRLPMNYEPERRQGPTLHFMTLDDIVSSARQLKDLSARTQDPRRRDNLEKMGFRLGMTDDEAIGAFKKSYPDYAKIGHARIKLFGIEHCVCKLKRVRDFLFRHPEMFSWDDEKGALSQHIMWLPFTVTTKRYCILCRQEALDAGLIIPLQKDQKYDIGPRVGGIDLGIFARSYVDDGEEDDIGIGVDGAMRGGDRRDRYIRRFLNFVVSLARAIVRAAAPEGRSGMPG